MIVVDPIAEVARTGLTETTKLATTAAKKVILLESAVRNVETGMMRLRAKLMKAVASFAMRRVTKK